MTFNVAKLDVERRHVYGYLSVVADPDGKLIVDKQGDYILPSDLEDTAKEFMLSSRDTGEMHDRLGVGRVFESMMFTTDKMEAMEKQWGLPHGYLTKSMPQGWWIGAEVNSGDDAWERVKSGERLAWSIGGSGRRI